MYFVKNIFNDFKLNEASEANVVSELVSLGGSIATYRPDIYYVFNAFKCRYRKNVLSSIL